MAAPTDDDINEALSNALTDPASRSEDGVSTASRSPSEIIALDRYLRSRAASSSTKNRNWWKTSTRTTPKLPGMDGGC